MICQCFVSWLSVRKEVLEFTYTSNYRFHSLLANMYNYATLTVVFSYTLLTMHNMYIQLKLH